MKEILAEMQNKKLAGGPTVSTVVTSAPWVKKGINTARERTQAVKAAETAKEKFDYVYGLKSTTSVVRVAIQQTPTTKVRASVRSYDPATGDIELQTAHHVYEANTNDFEYLGREKAISTPIKKYKFIAHGAEYSGDRPIEKKEPVKKLSPQEKRWAAQAAEAEKLKYDAWGRPVK
jgi:hypothetical protein